MYFRKITRLCYRYDPEKYWIKRTLWVSCLWLTIYLWPWPEDKQHIGLRTSMSWIIFSRFVNLLNIKTQKPFINTQFSSSVYARLQLTLSPTPKINRVVKSTEVIIAIVETPNISLFPLYQTKSNLPDGKEIKPYSFKTRGKTSC